MKWLLGWFKWMAFGARMMAWPTTGAGSLASGYLASGVTTIRWGSKELVTSIGGTANDGISVGVVLRINQKSLVENIKLPGPIGPTSTRVQIIDGQQWDITMRDDTALGLPRIGAAVVIVDMGGHISTVGLKYAATVIENGYDTASKQAGERNFSVENLILIESQTGS